MRFYGLIPPCSCISSAGVSAVPFQLATSAHIFCLVGTVNKLSAELTVARKNARKRQKQAAEDGVGRVGSWQRLDPP